MDANDIFISYAWADNQAPVGAVRPEIDRWVWLFRDALAAALSLKLDAPRELWIDRREMRANDRVDQVLGRELERSRLLLLMMSPRWIASPWCRAELETFLQLHAGTARGEAVFVVEIEPVPRQRWHPRVQGLGAFPFHKPLARGKGTVPLGHPLPDTRADRDYYLEIMVLAEQIRDVIEAEPLPVPPLPPTPLPPVPGMPAAAPAVASAAAPPAVPRERVVWIAEPIDVLLRTRRDLRHAIEQAGFTVRAPDLAALLREPAAGGIEQQLQRGLQDAGLLLHLLGASGGRLIGDGRSWTQCQHDLARALAEREGWPMVVWRDVGTPLDSDTTAHAELLKGAVEQGVPELLRDLLLRLPVRRLLPPAPSPAEQAAGAEPRPLSVCVSCCEEDEPLGDRVVHLLDELDTDYLRFTDGQGRRRAPNSAEDQALADSAGVIIVYGAADPNWLITKLQHAKHLRRRRDRVWGAVVDAPLPGKPPAPTARAIERHDWSAGPRADLMQRFVHTLVSDGAGGV